RELDQRDEVVVLADDALVRADADQHVQVAGRPPRLPGVSGPGQPDPLTVGDPGRDLDARLAAGDPPPAPPALVARAGRDPAVPPARVAGHRPHHLSEGRPGDRLEAARPGAARAGLDRRSRLGPVALAVVAPVDRLVGDLVGP